MAKLYGAYFYILLTISNIKCSILYADNNKKTSNILIIQSERIVPSKLSCAHYCQIKHDGDNIKMWHRNGQCKCLGEQTLVEIKTGVIQVIEEDVYTMAKIPKVIILCSILYQFVLKCLTPLKFYWVIEIT